MLMPNMREGWIRMQPRCARTTACFLNRNNRSGSFEGCNHDHTAAPLLIAVGGPREMQSCDGTSRSETRNAVFGSRTQFSTFGPQPPEYCGIRIRLRISPEKRPCDMFIGRLIRHQQLRKAVWGPIRVRSSVCLVVVGHGGPRNVPCV